MGRKKVNSYAVQEGKTQEEKIADMCHKLELEAVAFFFTKIIEKTREKHGTLYDFLEEILEIEMKHKEESRTDRWMRYARFPFKKTIEDFDFSFPEKIDKSLINELVSCRFIREGKNVILVGPPGVGKTHLSISLGLEAIHSGFETKFIPLNEFIIRVDNEFEVNSSSRILKSYLSPRLLIFDDMDFYKTSENASTILFQLVCKRHERKLSTMFTSNREFSDWGGLFGSSQRASAALDRIVGNAVIANIVGDSYRMKDKPKRDKQI